MNHKLSDKLQMTKLAFNTEQETVFQSLLTALEKSKTVKIADKRFNKAYEFLAAHSKVGFPLHDSLKARCMLSYRNALENMVN